MKHKPTWLPQNRQFSQADARVQQRPEGLDAPGAEGVISTDPALRNIERYSEIQVTPGRWEEAFVQTTQPVTSAGGLVTLIEKDLGFVCNSFLVDNWTNQWLYEPNLKRYVPPYSGGWTFLIPNGYQQARVYLRAPQSLVQPAAIVGEFVWMGWHEAALPPATGVVLSGSIAPSGASEVVIVDDAGAELLLNTATILGGTSATGSLPVDTPGEWSGQNTPAVNTIASFTKAAAGGVRHVARSVCADLVAGTPAPVVITGNPVLRDGASGVGTILWQRVLALQAVAGDKDHAQATSMNVVGTLGNAMTLEFLAAGGANTFESVALTGYDAT